MAEKVDSFQCILSNEENVFLVTNIIAAISFRKPEICPLSAGDNSWVTKQRSHKDVSSGWENTPKSTVHLLENVFASWFLRRTVCAQCVPYRQRRAFHDEEGQQSRTLKGKHAGKHDYNLSAHKTKHKKQEQPRLSRCAWTSTKKHLAAVSSQYCKITPLSHDSVSEIMVILYSWVCSCRHSNKDINAFTA